MTVPFIASEDSKPTFRSIVFLLITFYFYSLAIEFIILIVNFKANSSVIFK